ncbi:MAG: type II toxin-antitoxin system VapC family toxin [Rhodospirillales bacterium]|nr:type II toxin-antitoxin system VapC family toxin [Rhodospirillales bacterium]
MLAFILREPGHEKVFPHLGNGMASAVNIAEVGARLCDKGLSIAEARRTIERLYLEVVAFDVRLARISTAVRAATRTCGLSLGDRACLALSLDRRLPVLTADRAWKTVEIGVSIELIR